jgi:hypothetical protein
MFLVGYSGGKRGLGVNWDYVCEDDGKGRTAGKRIPKIK